MLCVFIDKFSLPINSLESVVWRGVELFVQNIHNNAKYSGVARKKVSRAAES